jgi:hypothetical protein
MGDAALVSRFPALALAVVAACSASAQQPAQSMSSSPPTPPIPTSSTLDASSEATVDASASVPTATVLVADPIPPRSAGGDVPATDATGSFTSPAKKDWPCAFREQFERDAEWRVKERFVYGKRASCRLPISFVDDGIVGCVVRSVVEFRGKHYDLRRMSYGTDGNLDVHESNFGTQRWSWDKDVPTPDDAIAVKRTPGRLSSSLMGRSVVDVDAAGRPLRVWNTDAKGVLESRCEYTYQGDRFLGKRCFDGGNKPTWRYEAMYDCSKLSKLMRSVNKRGELGTPTP